MKSLLRKWKRSKLIKTISLKEFTEKYINYFLNDFDPKSASYYDLFDSPDFPDECWSLGFDLDCGESFTMTYGREAWRSNKGLSSMINEMNNLEALGSGLFSKWRYFNHWAYEHATEEDKNWFLMILKRMQTLV